MAESAKKKFDNYDIGHRLPLKVSYARKKHSKDFNNIFEQPNYKKPPNKLLFCSVCKEHCTKYCGNCKAVAYCSVDCQKADFSCHKNNCDRLSSKNHHIHNLNSQATNLAFLAPQTILKNESSPEDYSCEWPSYHSINLKTYPLQTGILHTLKIIKISTKKYFYAIPQCCDALIKLKTINKLLEELDLKYSDKESKIFCALTKNGRSRAVFTCCLNSHQNVYRLIDEGVKVILSPKDVFPLNDPFLLETPPLAICCIFKDTDSFDQHFSNYTPDSKITIEANLRTIDNGRFLFDSYVKNKNIEAMGKLKKGVVYDMSIFSVVDWNDFFIRSSDLLSYEMQKLFARIYSSPEYKNDTENIFNVGDLAVCRVHQKGCRVQVLKIDGNECEILLIDSSEIIKTTLSKLKPLPPFHSYIPPLLIHSTLSTRSTAAERAELLSLSKLFHHGLRCKLRVEDILENSIYEIKILEFVDATHFVNPRLISDKFDPFRLDFRVMYVPIDADLLVTPIHFVSTAEFYVHIVRKDFAHILHRLHDKIEQFYSDPSNIAPIGGEISLGLPLMAYNLKGGWFRAKISSVLNDGTVGVSYVDFGIKEQLPQEHLAKIHPDFFSEPIQALRCCIHKSNFNEFSDLSDRLSPGNKKVINILFRSYHTASETYTVDLLKTPPLKGI